jgi:hypothetical protein
MAATKYEPAALLYFEINNFSKRVKNNGYTAGRELHGSDPAS